MASAGGEGELATPTGLALVTTMASSCSPLPELRIGATGIGAGTRDIRGRSNVVRVVLGEPESMSSKGETAGASRTDESTPPENATPSGAQPASSSLIRSIVPAGDSAADHDQLAAIRHEIQQQSEDGFDGSQVAHPHLIALCRAVFESARAATQRSNSCAREITAADLLDLRGTSAAVTEDVLREKVRFGIRYLHSCLLGRGTSEDGAILGRAATAEISRTLVWQWQRDGVLLADGSPVSADLVKRLIDDERQTLAEQRRDSPSDKAVVQRATEIFGQLVLSDEYAEYMTMLAYSYLP
jgi:malate synthase